MTEFLAAVSEHAFLRNALSAGLLASVACGVVGSYVAARRITYIAGGIAHCILGGMGAARYLQVTRGWEWLHPLYGAIASGLLAALIIGMVTIRGRQREDTVISALWAVGMAVGVLFIVRTPGYDQNLMSYLFGNILMVSSSELWLIAVLDALAVGVGIAFYDQLIAVCFDQEYARLRGVRWELYYLLLLCLTALTVVLLVTVVGLVMVIALLSLPVAVASRLARSLWQVMAGAAVLSALFTTAGLVVGYQADLPPSAVTILLAGVVYLVVLSCAGAAKRLGRKRASAEPTPPHAPTLP